MISINKQGNAIVIEFTDNDKYLFNGKIEVAPNELIVVVDDSEMATFRKSSNGDVLFSQLISDIQIAGSPVTKDTIINQFATIGFISVGGEDTVSSVNGQTGDVVITAESLNVYNKTEIDTALNGKQAAGDYATKTELQNVSADKADKADVYTKQEVNDKLATKQATLVQGDNITLSTPDAEGKVTISATQPDISGLATKIEVTEGLASKLDTATYNSEKAGFETKENAAATYQVKGDYATKSEMAGKQDTLVSGTNIKTINGNSILGEGNITVEGGSKVWTATANKNIRVDTSLNGAISLSNWTGEKTAKPGDVVHITYSNYNWNLVVTGRYKDNTGTYLALSGLGDLNTGYRISNNLMYSYVPFDKGMDSAIVIGRGAYANAGTKYEIAIGVGATTNGTNAVAIGAYGASANANATAVGSQADANEDGSTVIGSNLKANK